MAGFCLKPVGWLPPFYHKVEPRENSFSHRRRVGGITIFVRSRSNAQGEGGGGGTLGISGWGCAAGSMEPLPFTRASSAEFCYPILE